MASIDVERARALVGVPFRPQGRDEERGLDCVGLCLAAYRFPPDSVRRDYRLRGDYRNEVMAALLGRFRRISRRKRRPGDLLLLRVAADQLHLAVLTGAGFVHANARLRRVVETPGEPEWPLIGVYRRRVRRRTPPPCRAQFASGMLPACRLIGSPSPRNLGEERGE